MEPTQQLKPTLGIILDLAVALAIEVVSALEFSSSILVKFYDNRSQWSRLFSPLVVMEHVCYPNS